MLVVPERDSVESSPMEPVKLFLCGDVMTGRGIDQILSHPCDPRIHEEYVKDAAEYVCLAERVNGSIPRGVGDDYIWGEALEDVERVRPDARIINLETAVTRSEDWEQKGINYRMHPGNLGCLTAARIDCCVLANNHVLDWGEAGLAETLKALHAAGLRTAGAGSDKKEARAPAELPLPGGRRILIYALGMEDSGIPPSWEATASGPGVNYVAGLSRHGMQQWIDQIRASRRPGDVVVVSIHWGGNWGYRVPRAQAEFAHWLIDSEAADLVHGHSSHHPKAVEVWHDKTILYGCGDFINDYEGISGHEQFRADLGLMYFPQLDAASGALMDLELVAVRRKRFRLERASEADCRWLYGVLNAEGERFGTSFRSGPHSRFTLSCPSGSGDRRPA